MALLVVGCPSRSEPGHGHTHEDHAHGHDAEAEDVATLALTRWTDRNELFVEFPHPVANKPVRYHAHVTHLEGFKAAVQGAFRVRYVREGKVAAEAAISGVARPGIFTPEGMAPGPGTYTVEMVYENEGITDAFDCGPVTISDQAPAAEEEAPSSAITFLKESQWKIPFGTAWAEERLMARELELPATVESASTGQVTVSTTVAGRFFQHAAVALAEGQWVTRGTTLGHVVPNVTGEDYGKLRQTLEELRTEQAQLHREIERVTPLVSEGLRPPRDLIDLKNRAELQAVRVTETQARLERVVAPSQQGGVPVKAGMDGIISQVLVRNGDAVDVGTPLMRLSGTDRLWLRARFFPPPSASYEGARPAAVRLPDGQRVELDENVASLVSPLPTIDPATRIATWIIAVQPPRGSKAAATTGIPPLRTGSNVVALLQVGEPQRALAVPRGAVVEINARPYVFVQTGGESFEKRLVTLGRRDGDWVQVTSGIAAGERVVTRGGFDIHLNALMGTVESHRH
ncbi:MAG: efflux RND transporter periplasmic adaptor subunit [Myxococcota bacterium]